MGRLVELLTKDPLLKLTALVLAFLLWALVASERGAAPPPPAPDAKGGDSGQLQAAPVDSSRSVPVAVRLTGVPMVGWEVAGPPRVEPTHVTATGPASVLARIDSIHVPAIRLDGRMASATQDLAIDTAGLGVRIVPSRVRVTIPIRQIPPDTSDGGAAERPEPALAPAGAVP